MEGSCCAACLARVTRGRQGPQIEDSGYGPRPVDGFVEQFPGISCFGYLDIYCYWLLILLGGLPVRLLEDALDGGMDEIIVISSERRCLTPVVEGSM